MSVESGSSGGSSLGGISGGIGGAVTSVGAELASPTAFFESNMNIVSIIKAADVVMGPPVMVGGGMPIIHQAEAVASAVWSRAEVPKAFDFVPNTAQQFFENNLNILSIMPIFSFQPEPKTSELNAANAISEAENILQQARRPQVVLSTFEPMIVPPPQPELDTFFRPEPVVKSDQAVARSVSRPAQQRAQPALTTRSLSEQAPRHMVLGQVEKAAEETQDIAESPVNKDHTRLAEQQRIEAGRLINVEDWQVAQQRRFEISQAIKRIWMTVKEGRIFGWMVARFLPGQHEGNTSQLVKRLAPDGSLVDTEQAIKTDPREFKSQEQAKEGLLPYVAIFKPAKKAKEGKRLARQEVARVVRYLLVKPSQAYEVFIKRKFKRIEAYKGNNPTPVLITEQIEVESAEPSLESNPQLAAALNPVLTDSNSLS